jgi:hypothetical protein
MDLSIVDRKRAPVNPDPSPFSVGIGCNHVANGGKLGRAAQGKNTVARDETTVTASEIRLPPRLEPEG